MAEITKELLEKRLSDLNKQKAEVEANYSAILGAIQDCNYWFSILNSNPSGDKPQP